MKEPPPTDFLYSDFGFFLFYISYSTEYCLEVLEDSAPEFFYIFSTKVSPRSSYCFFFFSKTWILGYQDQNKISEYGLTAKKGFSSILLIDGLARESLFRISFMMDLSPLE